MTRLCVAIFAHSAEQIRRDAARAAEAGADVVELRIDRFDGGLPQLPRQTICPAIVTDRAAAEGGQSERSDAERVARLESIGDSAAWTDAEYETFKRFPRLRNAANQLILSSHDFRGRPERLTNLFAELTASPADIAKIVWTARSIRDNLEAFELLLHKQKPAIALCMGEAGLISRVLAKKFGAFLTFASLDDASGTAPGQISIADMKWLYRWDAISPSTKVYGVVGSPIAHSMSPAIQNAAFEAAKHDGVYLPLLVNPGYESFKAFMESFLAFEPLDLSGLSVTIPHKENALRYLREKGGDIEPLALSIGAVNTIAIDRTGGGAVRLRGINTDYAAILDSITGALSIGRGDLRNYRAAVLGAGGTGRTAVAALAHFGATVVIYNRTRERADNLAAEFNGKTGKVVAADWAKLCDSCCQIYINTTNIGMSPNINASPFGEAMPKLPADALVFDAVYNPPQTKLLRDAAAAGATTVSGIEMFLRQAAGQFELWTRTPAPTNAMRAAIDQRLKVL